VSLGLIGDGGRATLEASESGPANCRREIRAGNRGKQMSEHTKTVTDDSFSADVLKAPGPVLVDFWAEWCGPCRAIAPAIDEISAEYAGKLTVAKVNIDENPMTPTQYNVRGIPTLMLFKDGKPVATQVGAAPKSALRQWVADAI
jgi:thioredoxin 1